MNVYLNVSKLSGAELDAAVAKAEGLDVREVGSTCWVVRDPGRGLLPYEPSTDWDEGGAIIHRERIDFRCGAPGDEITATIIDDRGVFVGFGPTHLVAAMRAFLESKAS